MKYLVIRSLLIPVLLIAVLIANGQSAIRDKQSVNLRHICRLPGVLTESSGIAIEGSNRIWSHEDSGNAAEIYCFDTTGNLLRTLTIENANNIDWEDMTSDNEETWYIGDAGNNNCIRTDLAIYKIPSPETFTENSVTAGIIRFNLPDQLSFPPPSSDRNYDIEAIVWHSDSLFLFTKDRSNPFTGITKMYVLPDIPGNYTARLAGSLQIGNTPETGRITSADINHHTGELILLTNTKLVSFTNYPNNRFFDGDVTEYTFTSIPGQNESIGFVSTTKLYMTEEGSGSTEGYLYEINLPKPQAIESLDASDKLIMLYPNPAKDQVRVSCSLTDNFKLEIRDLEGRIFIQQAFSKETDVNIGYLEPDIYLLILENDSVRISKRFLKF